MVKRCGQEAKVFSKKGKSNPRRAAVVSGLSSSKVSACSSMIKEFCEGKAGWTDRAIFTETDLKPASESDAAAL